MGASLFALVLLQWKYTGTTNKGGNAAAILFINIFGAALGFFLDPTQFIVSIALNVFHLSILTRLYDLRTSTYMYSCFHHEL